jgi:hypothetical protein
MSWIALSLLFLVHEHSNKWGCQYLLLPTLSFHTLVHHALSSVQVLVWDLGNSFWIYNQLITNLIIKTAQVMRSLRSCQFWGSYSESYPPLHLKKTKPARTVHLESWMCIEDDLSLLEGFWYHDILFLARNSFSFKEILITPLNEGHSLYLFIKDV